MLQLIPDHGFTQEMCDIVSSLDPLQAVRSLHDMAACNRSGDVNGLILLFRRLLPKLNAVREADFNHKTAMMRDLGMFLGSLKRHGQEPLAVVPEAEAVLLQIAQGTNMPPRDTLLHYSIWNPRGPAMRLYTGSEMEAAIVGSLQDSIPPLEQALYKLERMYAMDITDANYRDLCEQVCKRLDALVKAIVSVYRSVPASYFLDDLRPFYEPVVIGGKVYTGPGAVEIPLFLVDHVLWACDDTTPEYCDMKERGLHNVLPHWREMYHRLKGKQSITSMAITELNQGRYDRKTSLTVQQNVAGIDEIFAKLTSFRMPHLKLADTTYGGEKPKFNKDRDGYGKSVLRTIVDLMKDRRKQLNHAARNLGCVTSIAA